MIKQSQYDPNTGDLSFPDSLSSLEGQTVSIAGFMAPYDKLDDMTLFMLMPSYVGCHFCEPPALNQVLYIEQAGAAEKKKKPQFIHEPILVTGTLRIFSPESEHDAHLAEFVYALDAASLKILDGAEALEKAKAIHTQTGSQQPGHGAVAVPDDSEQSD